MDARRKRLLYRSRHRGMHETDLLLGRFAELHLGELDAAQLDRFEALVEETDHDLYDWIAGKRPVPAGHDHDVMARLRAFRHAIAAKAAK